MATYIINVRAVLGESFFKDVTVAALEGGINYWALVVSVNYETGIFKVKEHEDYGTLHTFTYHDLAVATERILQEDLAGSMVLSDIQRGVTEGDAGMIDALAADVIVQVAALGDVIYG